MNEISLKNIEKVLKKILNIPLNNAGYIYRPTNFEKEFPFLKDPASLDIILRVLNDGEYLIVDFSDISDDCFIDTISITAKGYQYFALKKHDTFHFWTPIILSNALAFTAILISLLSWLR